MDPLVQWNKVVSVVKRQALHAHRCLVFSAKELKLAIVKSTHRLHIRTKPSFLLLVGFAGILQSAVSYGLLLGAVVPTDLAILPRFILPGLVQAFFTEAVRTGQQYWVPENTHTYRAR